MELLAESQATLQSQKSEAQQANKKRAMLGEPTEVRFLYKNLRKKKLHQVETEKSSKRQFLAHLWMRSKEE